MPALEDPRQFRGRTFVLLMLFFSAFAQIIVLLEQQEFAEGAYTNISEVILIAAAISLVTIPVSLFFIISVL